MCPDVRWQLLSYSPTAKHQYTALSPSLQSMSTSKWAKFGQCVSHSLVLSVECIAGEHLCWVGI